MSEWAAAIDCMILTVQPILDTPHLPKSLDALSVAKNKMI